MKKLVSGAFEIEIESAIEALDIYNRKHTLSVILSSNTSNDKLKDVVASFEDSKGLDLIVVDRNIEVYKYSKFSLIKASSSFFDFKDKKHTLIFDIEC